MGSRRICLHLLVLSGIVLALGGLGFAQGWRIDNAVYGGAAPRRVDVTNRVINLVRGSGSIRITNEILGVGDPAPGEVKYLHIQASRPDGRTRDFEVREKDYLDAGMFIGGPGGPGPGGPGPGYGPGGPGGPGPVWGRGPRPRRGACFFRDPDFSGDYFCMSPGQSFAYLPPGFNDRITSIRVIRAEVVLYNDRDFRGVNAASRRNIADLRNWRLPSDRRRSWNDRVSSIQVQ